jgi:4-aminobutyrate aminotransferase-like enzyme
LIGTAGGNTLRFAPPLIISEQEAAHAVSLLGLAISGRETSDQTARSG